MVNRRTMEIIAIVFGNGSTHDFRLFKENYVETTHNILCLAATGYQGINKLHTNCQISTKSSKLTPEQKAANRELASKRIFCEHVINRLKVFRILRDGYRNLKKRFALRFNLDAAIYNFELSIKS